MNIGLHLIMEPNGRDLNAAIEGIIVVKLLKIVKGVLSFNFERGDNPSISYISCAR